MAENERHVTTAAMRKEYENELNVREHETRQEINERLKTAREFGDLSENAEYDAAREEQAANEQRINELKRILATAEVIDTASMDTRNLTAAVGTEVELEDANGRHITFVLVGTNETNSLLNQISNESPAGKALIGCGVGDEISFNTPAGKTVTYHVVNIRLSRSEGDE